MISWVTNISEVRKQANLAIKYSVFRLFYNVNICFSRNISDFETFTAICSFICSSVIFAKHFLFTIFMIDSKRKCLLLAASQSFSLHLNIFFQLLKGQHISCTSFIASAILKRILHFLSSLLRNDTLTLLWNVVSRLYVLFVALLLVSCLLDLSLA